MPALFLRDAHSGGSFRPSPVGNISCGPWRCCQGLDAAGSVFLYRESERGGGNLPCSICHGLELFEQVPSSPPFQALRSWECCWGCTLEVVRHRGKHPSLCEMHAIICLQLLRHWKDTMSFLWPSPAIASGCKQVS